MEKEPTITVEQLSAKIVEASKLLSDMSELVAHFNPKRAHALRELLEKRPPRSGDLAFREKEIALLKKLEEGGQTGKPFAGYDIDPATGYCEELGNDMVYLVHAVAAEVAKGIIDDMAEQLKKI